jgi:predicted AAA+ superfamily ATPase
VLLRRAIEERYRETVAARRVTVVTGPRQSGKTTLVLGQLGIGTLRSLDDQGVLDAALADPGGFVALGARPLVIDEVQRGGEPLVRAVKAVVDRDPAPGQFVLTGSSNFLTVPTISESLAGRAGFVEVWPFTQGELAGRTDRFLDTVFGGGPGALAGYEAVGLDRRDVCERLCTGGYPEPRQLPARQRAAWFRDYVRTTIERDVVELSGIRKVAEMGQLLRLFAARTGCELVMQSVINDSALERQAVYDHRAWLETIHLVATVPAWSRNLTRRVKRRPKVFITDTGLAAWLLGKTPAALENPTDPAIGQLVETFVFAELRRQLTWAGAETTMFHWRDRAGAEVDLVLEAADGRVVGIEVKAGQTPRTDWFRWLARMRDSLGGQFVAGLALYSGDKVLPFGDRLLAVPISALWEL